MVSLEMKLLLAYLSPFVALGLYFIIKSGLRQLFLGMFYYLVLFVTFLLFLQTIILSKKSFKQIELREETVNWLIFNFHSNNIAIFIYLLLLFSIALLVYFTMQKKE